MAVPGAPTGFKVESNGRKVTLSWTALTATPAVTKFQYARKSGSGSFGSWIDISGSGPTTTSAVLRGQPVGAQTYKIRAVNSDGDGAESASLVEWIMAVQGSLEATLSVSSSAPATFNASGYGAVTFTSCGEITNLDEFGREYEVVRINNLADGATRKFKGSFDNGTISAELLFDSGDAGQTILEAAETSVSTYYFKVELQGGEIFYFAGLVTTFKRRIGGPNDAVMVRVTIEIDHRDIVEA